MSVMPIILRSQENIRQNSSNIVAEHVADSSLDCISSDNVDYLAPSSPPSSSQYSQQALWTRSPFEKLGIYRRKLIRYHHLGSEGTGRDTRGCDKDIISEKNELSLVSAIIGFA